MATGSSEWQQTRPMTFEEFRGGPCRVYSSDVRLRVSEAASYYPDVQVVCDSTDTDQQFTTRPCLIVESLSRSTAS